MNLQNKNYSGAIQVTLKINGAAYDLQIEPRVSLLDTLREFAGLTGTKKGCNQGACGACTILVDGERINSCFALAVQYEGSEIATIEGLANNGELHALQSAFVEHDGFQCGYCTPGQICSAIGMFKEFQNGLPSAVSENINGKSAFSDEEIKERMSGNLVSLRRVCRHHGSDSQSLRCGGCAMKNFAYSRAETVNQAIQFVSDNTSAKYLGGGTNLVDLMRENIEQPGALVDATRLEHEIEETSDGGIRIGAGGFDRFIIADSIWTASTSFNPSALSFSTAC